MKRFGKGVMGLSLEMLIAITITAAVILLIYMNNAGFGPKLMESMRGMICLLPGLC